MISYPIINYVIHLTQLKYFTLHWELQTDIIIVILKNKIIKKAKKDFIKGLDWKIERITHPLTHTLQLFSFPVRRDELIKTISRSVKLVPRNVTFLAHPHELVYPIEKSFFVFKACMFVSQRSTPPVHRTYLTNFFINSIERKIIFFTSFHCISCSEWNMR